MKTVIVLFNADDYFDINLLMILFQFCRFSLWFFFDDTINYVSYPVSRQ